MFVGPQEGGGGYKTSPSSIYDGMSTTILMSENNLAGATVAGTPYTGGFQTTWASPFPQTCTFIASHHICDTGSGDCTKSNLFITNGPPQIDGVDWSRANSSTLGESINSSNNYFTDKGAAPYANSGHPGNVNVAMCDGSVRNISATVDGTVYAKLLSPAGGKLPTQYKQLPLDQDAY